MDRNSRVKLALAGLVVVVFVVFFNWASSLNTTVKTLQGLHENEALHVISMKQSSTNEVVDSGNSKDSLFKVLKQRNELSALLNDMRMQVGRMQCEKNKDRIDDQGGWCKEASKEDGGQHLTDKTLVKTLSKFLKGKSVASFGDGPGAYKREILKLGEVAGYDAFDGAPYCEQTSEGRVKFLDLTVPQFGLPAYDWIVSLEVAEHIPAKYEAVYLDNIFRHAKEGIILSWAVPGQGGLNHVNNKALTYIIDVMKRNGFEIDMEKSKTIQDGSTLDWLKRNTHVYVRSQVSRVEDTLYI